MIIVSNPTRVTGRDGIKCKQDEPESSTQALRRESNKRANLRVDARRVYIVHSKGHVLIAHYQRGCA